MHANRPRLLVAARPTDRGTRLDRFLQDALEPISRKQVKRLLDAGRVRMAGRPIHRAGRLLGGMEVFEVEGIPGSAEPSSISRSRILYLDDHIVAADKPAGLRTHAVEPGDRRNLVSYLEDLLEIAPLRVVSRLDKETSGVIVLALTAAAATALTDAFSSHAIEKTYRAVVHGLPPGGSGVIEAPIGPIGRGRFGITRRGRLARTRYQVSVAGREMSVVTLFPETGRTHQLRVQMAALGTPIAGDLAYGGRRSPGVVRTLLHAESIELLHPNTGKPLSVRAPLPEDLLATIAACRGG